MVDCVCMSAIIDEKNSTFDYFDGKTVGRYPLYCEGSAYKNKTKGGQKKQKRKNKRSRRKPYSIANLAVKAQRNECYTGETGNYNNDKIGVRSSLSPYALQGSDRLFYIIGQYHEFI